MKKMLKTLAELFHGNWIVTVSALVVTVMVAVVVVNGAGEDSRFTPDTTNALSYYGTPEAEGITYNLSEDDQSGKDINQNSDRDREREEPETENTLGNEEKVILPSDMSNPGGQPTVDAPVDNTLGTGDNPGYNPNQPGGFTPGGNNPGGNPGGEVVNPRPDRPSGNKPSGGSNSGGNPGGGKVTVGGKEYDSINDALADIADNQDKDKNDQGQYFEGFVKDENGNYVTDENGNLIPSYSDKFDNGSGGDVSMDYSGDSGIYVVPSVATLFEMNTITNKSIHTIVIPKQITGIVIPEFGMNDSQLTTIIVSKDNQHYMAEDGVLYDVAGERLLLCPPAKKTIAKFPAALKSVDASAFAESRMEELELPNTVTEICSNAFINSYIEKIVIPDSVETIGEFAFMTPTIGEDEDGFQRTVVLKGKTPPAVNSNVFANATGNKISIRFVIDSESRAVYEHYLATWGMTLAKHWSYDGEQALNMLQTADNLQDDYIYDSERQGFVEKSTDRLIAWSDANGIFRLDENGDTVLVKWTATGSFIDLKEKLKIDPGAFDGCAVKTIRITGDITEMPENIFAGCSQLRSIICYAATPLADNLGVPEITGVFVKPESEAAYKRAWGDQVRKIFATSDAYSVSSDGQMVFDKVGSQYRLLDVPMDATELAIPSYTNIIAEGAMKDRTRLLNITGGSKLAVIENEAFAGCTALRSMVLGATVTEIGESAFEGCSALKSVATASQYQYLFIQANVKSVGARAFKGCSSLPQIFWYSTAGIPDSCFEGCSALAYLNYTDGALKEIGERAFAGCLSLVRFAPVNDANSYLWIKNNFRQVGAGAFKDCSALTQVYWYLPTIPRECFSGCGRLTWFSYLDNTLTGIGERALEGCRSLISFSTVWQNSYAEVQGTVTNVGVAAFKDCSGLTELKWHSGSIPESCFYGCKAMTTAYIAPSVVAIGDNAFGGRGGNALTITMAALTPPFMGAVDSLANLVIYVPDSEEHAVYGAYRTAWESWLGEHPEQVLKTASGAENLWGQPDPEPEPTEPDNPNNPDSWEDSGNAENGGENGDNSDADADPVNHDEAVQPTKPEDSGEGGEDAEEDETPKSDSGSEQNTEDINEEI